MVELLGTRQEVEREGGVGGELFVEGEVDFLFGDAGDLGAVEEAVGDYVVDLAGFGSEDSGEVGGLGAGERGGGGGPGVGDEATGGHPFEFSVFVEIASAVLGNGCGRRDGNGNSDG